MASQSSDDRYYIAADASGMDKIDGALRLAGLQFPKNRPVLGRNQAGLILALSAFDAKHNRAGKQLIVVRRLCIFYDALNIHKDHPALDINGDTFYEAAIDSISKKYPGTSKYLTPASLRHVIDLYRKAFHNGGVRPVKPNAKKTDDAQETTPVQPDATQPNDNGGETGIGETLTEPPKPLNPIGDRVTLEKLVKEWMVVRAVARSNEGTGEEPEVTNTPNLEKYPIKDIHRERELCGGDSYKLLEDNYKMLKNDNELLKAQKKALMDDNELLKTECKHLRQHIAEVEEMLRTIERMNDTIAKQVDERDELMREMRMSDEHLAYLHRQIEDSGGFPGGSGGSGGFPGLPES